MANFGFFFQVFIFLHLVVVVAGAARLVAVYVVSAVIVEVAVVVSNHCW